MKRDRSSQQRVRAQWMALGGALVVLAGVVVAWGLGEAAARVPVVQVATAVPAGATIEAGALTVTGVAYDGAVQGLVPAGSLDAVAGRVAAVDLVPGQLLQQGMWRDTPPLLPGEQAVGVVLAPGRAPADLAPGDAATAAPLQVGDPTAPVAVRVLTVAATEQGDTALTLAVPATGAVVVAQLAATEQLVLVGHPGAGAP